ncbi:MAG: trypsin-like peptidase domain-containing protein [Candidatus Heimdallarchaeota archaeon]|nr:trypsin-like peptidase domain-containing protein [Candidatus Heimdallarchaeota archaeon]
MLGKLEQTIVDVVDNILPSVVSVSTTVLARIDLFNIAPIQGQGSGIIIDEEGLILTNAHVVKKAQKVEVQLHNGKKLEAEVLGSLREQDIAILKVPKDKNLKAIKLGESRSLKVGQFAIAVGNALGLGVSVTFGLVSALNRTISTQVIQLEGLIQTTADINPGNSGGALLNTTGELIGIPTAVIQYSQGMGFAIAVDSIKGVLEEFRRTGKISTPWLGVIGYTIDSKLANYYKLAKDKGALILEVPNGPAKKAGIIQGDIIVEFNGEDVDSIQMLTQKISKLRIGDEITLKILRESKIFSFTLNLDKAPN